MDADVKRLFDLAIAGDLQTLKDFVEDTEVKKRKRDSLLNISNEDGMTVLHVAVIYNHASIIEWTLSSEGGRACGFAKILVKDKDGSTALHIGAARGRLECCRALVQGSKIENGEREELLNGADGSGWTALHHALWWSNPSIVEWLLLTEEGGGRDAGFTSSSITTKTLKSESALHLAAYSGSLKCLNALLDGCTIGERSTLFRCFYEHGWTALHCAAQWCRSDIIRELLLHYPETQMIVDIRDNRGMTALHRAVIGGVDDASREEWRVPVGWGEELRNVAKLEVVTALLTFPNKLDDNKKDDGGKAEGNGGEKSNESQQQQQQQAAFADPNVGTQF